MPLRRFFILFLISFALFSYAQPGGNNTYEFLNLPLSARANGLGANMISIKDHDVNLAFQNPSLLDSTMHNALSLSYMNYYAGVKYGYSGYAGTFKNIGTFSAGIQYLDYGSFTAADATGETTGTFGAADYMLNIGYGRQIDSLFSVGANLKTVYSALETYTSFGNAVDVAGTYHNQRHLFTIAAIVKNLGKQWKPYREGNYEPLPFEVQLGISKKLGKAPLRFTLFLHNLEKWDLTYVDPNNPTPTVDPITNEPIKQKKIGSFGDKIGRHVIGAVEILPGKNFHIRIAYNYQRAKDLKAEARAGIAGFSGGFGIKIYKFQINYGRSVYHIAGGTNMFTVTTNISDFLSTKRTHF